LAIVLLGKSAMNPKMQDGAEHEARFEELFQHQLEELYDAETRMADALPKLVADSSSETLTRALQAHLDETKQHVSRLETIFEQMGEEAVGRRCEGMRGLVDEAETALTKGVKSPVIDLAIVIAARKMEHYEIAAYESAYAIAETLGQEDIALVLREILNEETQADGMLSSIAEGILTGDENPSQYDTEGMAGA
jgi:ferritin-like metal-binding protein YciE